MSLYGMMRTGVSGMNAQSTRLGTVADNIANSGTNGYKKASVEFSSLVVPNTGTTYVSGGVSTQVRYDMGKGNLQYTTSVTDLAVDGNGFFVVEDAAGQPFLTRAGSFIPDGNGNLVNAAGFYLMGRSFELGEPGASTAYGDFERVSIPTSGLERVPTTGGSFASNLPYNAPVYADTLPSTNPAAGAGVDEIAAGMEAGSIYKTSTTAIGNAGQPIKLDMYFTKTAPDTWEVSVFPQPGATAGSGFPYLQDDGVTPVVPVVETLVFDPATGNLDETIPSATGITLDLTTLNGLDDVQLDFSNMRQLEGPYTPLESDMNGSATSAIDSIIINDDGLVIAQYANGAKEDLYRLDLAFVQSPDQLNVLPGNVFKEGLESGQVNFGRPNEIALGAIKSGALEASNVDIAEELTNMIESQRNYTANSKVFQTGSDLMDVLVNLAR
ncbi:flagellar hook protein FlgE [Mesorhizobium sp. CAU 1741]|uniref:flagellar hook protein FlgE n=1 Tax=Mesorhizobium sp. CAU 1741 TaxID=3140366 RepID=UPI00325ADF5C